MKEVKRFIRILEDIEDEAVKKVEVSFNERQSGLIEMAECWHYGTSRTQRNAESLRGGDTRGTLGYEKTGCYNCDGFDYNCAKYSDLGKDLAQFILENRGGF